MFIDTILKFYLQIVSFDGFLLLELRPSIGESPCQFINDDWSSN